MDIHMMKVRINYKRTHYKKERKYIKMKLYGNETQYTYHTKIEQTMYRFFDL